MPTPTDKTFHVLVALAASSEKTIKLHSIDGPIQVGYAEQRPTVLVGAVCDYLDSLILSMSYLSSLFPSSPT